MHSQNPLEETQSAPRTGRSREKEWMGYIPYQWAVPGDGGDPVGVASEGVQNSAGIIPDMHTTLAAACRHLGGVVRPGHAEAHPHKLRDTGQGLSNERLEAIDPIGIERGGIERRGFDMQQ